MHEFDTYIDRNGTGARKWARIPAPVRAQNHIPFSVADMELKTAPEIIKALVSAAEHGICGYTGPDELYISAVKSWMKQRHEWDIEADWLCTTSGVVQALNIAVRAFSEPNDEIVIQPPVYHPFLMSIENNKRKPLYNQLIYQDGKYTMDLDGFERLCKRPSCKLFILCSPHNPIGRVWAREELEAVAKICKQNDVLVICDEIHFDLVMPGYKHTVLDTIPEARGNCVIMTAISKTFNMAGLAASNIFIPDKGLREKFETECRVTGGTGLSYFGRAATIAAYNGCSDWLDALIEYIVGNNQLIYDFIKTRIPKLKCIKVEGTYLMWIDCNGLGMDHERLDGFMKNEALLDFDNGHIFGAQGDGFVRWNVAAPRAHIKMGLERLEAAIKRKGL